MKVILVSHGDFAAGLCSTLTNFFGAQNVYSACVSLETGAESLHSAVKGYLEQWGDEEKVVNDEATDTVPVNDEEGKDLDDVLDDDDELDESCKKEDAPAAGDDKGSDPEEVEEAGKDLDEEMEDEIIDDVLDDSQLSDKEVEELTDDEDDIDIIDAVMGE